jgi:quinohemoprotein ethanol dehydrogenase
MVAVTLVGCDSDQQQGRLTEAQDSAAMFGEWHSSSSTQINTENIGDLGLAWEYRIPKRGRVGRGQEATPVMVDGILYTSTAWSRVVALDARTGKELWFYDPQVDGSYGRRTCCDVVNRGVEVYQGKVFVATLDGNLVALDAKTGAVIWQADTFVDRSPGRFYSITGAPQIAGGKVIIGNSGAEFGVRGYITAYEAETGEFAWRFYTVPGDPKLGFEHPEMEMAAQTWDPESAWEIGGGGTVWGEMAYDPNLNLLYVGTGNSSPYPQWRRSPSGGDNLFLSSILAINPDTGRLQWHYQNTPGEIWDYTAVQPIILADMEWAGYERKLLMQAPKNGFFYVLDRETGELLSAEPFVTVTWASHVDIETGRPVLTEQGDYSEGPKLVYPSAVGGHNWQPMSYLPDTGLVYIPAIDQPMIYLDDGNSSQFRPGHTNFGVRDLMDGIDQLPAEQVEELSKGQPDVVEESLLAWDPVKGRAAWRITNPGMWNGGLFASSGNLLIQGSDSGHLKIYRADNGELLREIHIGTSVMAGAMSYSLDGEQYIAVMAGYGGGLGFAYSDIAAPRTYENYGRVLAFKLGGGAVPLPPERLATVIPAPPQNVAEDPEQIARGAWLYTQHCGRCHNAPGANHSGNYPNLGAMPEATHQVFDDIVLNGAMNFGGMAGFDDQLNDDDSRAIHEYLISAQHDAYSAQNASSTQSIQDSN